MCQFNNNYERENWIRVKQGFVISEVLRLQCYTTRKKTHITSRTSSPTNRWKALKSTCTYAILAVKNIIQQLQKR